MSSLTRLKLSSGADRAMFIVALGIMAALRQRERTGRGVAP